MIYAFIILFSTMFHPPRNTSPVEVVTLGQLQQKVVHKNNDSLYVVNFWATWCAPCVKEIPYFEGATKHFADKKVKIILVSLDFLSEQEKVNSFIGNNNLSNNVYLLDAGDANVWIDKVDKNWTGSIPATVIYRKGIKIYFHEGDFTSEKELDSLIQKLNK